MKIASESQLSNTILNMRIVKKKIRKKQDADTIVNIQIDKHTPQCTSTGILNRKIFLYKHGQQTEGEVNYIETSIVILRLHLISNRMASPNLCFVENGLQTLVEPSPNSWVFRRGKQLQESEQFDG